MNRNDFQQVIIVVLKVHLPQNAFYISHNFINQQTDP